MRSLSTGTAGVLAAALAAGVAASAGVAWRVHDSDVRATAAQQQTIARMQNEINVLTERDSEQTDWSQLAARTEPSVFTISTEAGLGSGWVVRSDVSGSDLVTNFHVVAEAVAMGEQTVDVVQADRTLKGTVVRTDRTDDLAVVHVRERLAPLKPATARPRLGTTVMVLGSPLGLGGSISIGLVSGFRSIDGSDYVQFSAPISPGNSGGPVIDSRGHVVAVASAKLIGTGVEALSLAIPVQVVCLSLVSCSS